VHTTRLERRGLANGVYFLRVEADGEREATKVLVLDR
jgi:hypothetical protein